MIEQHPPLTAEEREHIVAVSQRIINKGLACRAGGMPLTFSTSDPQLTEFWLANAVLSLAAEVEELRCKHEWGEIVTLYASHYRTCVKCGKVDYGQNAE